MAYVGVLAVEVLRLEVDTPMLVAVQLADHLSYELLTMELIASKEKHCCRTHMDCGRATCGLLC